MTARGKVLVADDSAEIADFIAEALTEEGYTVRRAATGHGVLAAILADPPDLVLIDLVLGGMSGLDVMRALQIPYPSIPIVIMTTSPRFAHDLKENGIAVCLLKPFTLDDLLTCVAQHIRRQNAAGRK